MSTNEINNNTVMNVPAPEEIKGVNAFDTNEMDIEMTPDTILSEILSINKDGHTPCMITMSLERVKKVIPGKAFLDYTEEEKEYVDQVEINDCSVDISTLDGMLFNAVFTFDTKDAQYLKDMNEMFNRYRQVTEEYALNNEQEKGIALTVLIAPDRFMGKGILAMSFPVMGIRCLADNGENASMFMMFHQEDVDFISVEMTKEEEVQITADVMRATSEGGDGSIF